MSRSLTLAELVEVYLAQHDVEPVTIEKLRWLLGKAVAVFGERPVSELRSEEIAAWRMRSRPGYRFEATQALRQVLARAVIWGMIDVNPAKLGVETRAPRCREQRPFESWAELDASPRDLAPRYGPMVMFAAATGLRPAEWLALEQRDIDLEARVVYVRRSFTKGAAQVPQDGGEHARGAAADDRARRDRTQLSSRHAARCCSPPSAAATSTCTTSATASGSRPRRAAGIEPLRRVYDLRHTFATFALRAGISTFDLSRYMGASLTMIDRHYGHLARDGREHAIRLLDELSAANVHGGRWWTLGGRRTPATAVSRDNGSSG